MSEFLTFKSEETVMTESTPPATPSLRLTRLCERHHLDLKVTDFVKVQGQDCIQHWSGAMIPEVEVLRDLATRSGLVALHLSHVLCFWDEQELMERRAAFDKLGTFQEGSFLRQVKTRTPRWEELVEKIGQDSLSWWKTIRG